MHPYIISQLATERRAETHAWARRQHRIRLAQAESARSQHSAVSRLRVRLAA